MMSMNRDRRWRWTKQRRLIVEAIHDRRDHPTAEELYNSLRARGADISLATVYRNLRALAREGVIKEIHGDGPDRFDPVVTPHYHFRCEVCGRVYDVDVPYREELDKLPFPSGFEVHGHEITWVGICPACREEKRRRS
jgi:Fe2+ or Zn2+ uptake regulation protein